MEYINTKFSYYNIYKEWTWKKNKKVPQASSYPLLLHLNTFEMLNEAATKTKQKKYIITVKFVIQTTNDNNQYS